MYLSLSFPKLFICLSGENGSTIRACPPKNKRKRRMKPDRLFYTATGAIFLILTVIGFQHYIFGGRHFDGTPISPLMLATVVAHSSAIFAWFVLFFVQALLISTQ